MCPLLCRRRTEDRRHGSPHELQVPADHDRGAAAAAARARAGPGPGAHSGRGGGGADTGRGGAHPGGGPAQLQPDLLPTAEPLPDTGNAARWCPVDLKTMVNKVFTIDNFRGGTY